MNTPSTPDTMIELPSQQLESMRARMAALAHDNEALKRELQWFKRQLFGVKSEKRIALEGDQASLFATGPVQPATEALNDTVDVPGHKRRKHRTGDEVQDSGLRFGPDVPVREIKLPCAQLSGPDAHLYEIIDHKQSLRLARQPGAHVVLKYLRPVVRRKDNGTLITTAAPLGVLDHAQVDVSFLAGMLIDKFVYHCPLYRLHQKLADEGIVVARSTIDGWVRRTIDLLNPIAKAIWQMILQGAHIKIDETPVKAGRTKVKTGANAGQGKMKTGWLWPVLGENGDIAFGYSDQRSFAAAKMFLGEAYSGTIQTDGYAVYAKYAAQYPNCVHALCWAHSRRAFVKAKDSDPQAVAVALEMIGGLYAIESQLKKDAADAQEILSRRKTYSEPIVDRFFAWVQEEIEKPTLLPNSPLAKALGYVRERREGLRVFLGDAWLDLDTNDLERALRIIPMGKKNWLFCSTETGAKQLSTIQTVLATCRVHGIDPYTYLIDVLQRISITPDSQVAQLTPREWAKRFADSPLRSDLAMLGQ